MLPANPGFLLSELGEKEIVGGMALAGVVPLCWDSVSHRETSTHGSQGEIPYNSPQVSALYSSPFVWEHCCG